MSAVLRSGRLFRNSVASRRRCAAREARCIPTMRIRWAATAKPDCRMHRGIDIKSPSPRRTSQVWRGALPLLDVHVLVYVRSRGRLRDTARAPERQDRRSAKRDVSDAPTPIEATIATSANGVRARCHPFVTTWSPATRTLTKQQRASTGTRAVADGVAVFRHSDSPAVFALPLSH